METRIWNIKIPLFYRIRSINFPQTILTLIHLMKMFCRLCILKLLLTKMHGHGTVAQRADGIRAALKSDSDLVGIVMASRSTGGDGVKGIF
uniref:Uncharacterized protein n=1 Tax=Globodera rostochiensis TaxID=31243 RepID=A0A914HRZ9_GLORO